MSDFHAAENIHEGDPDAAAQHEVIEREASQTVYNRRSKKLTPVTVQYRQCGCVSWEHPDD